MALWGSKMASLVERGAPTSPTPRSRSDGHPDYPALVGENMALALGGTDKDRLTTIFKDLAESGTIKMPLTQQPWGADVGWLTDQNGVSVPEPLIQSNSRGS